MAAYLYNGEVPSIAVHSITAKTPSHIETLHIKWNYP